MEESRIQSGSWQAWCAGAGLRCNIGPSWGPIAWEKAVGTPPAEIYHLTATKALQRTEHNVKERQQRNLKHKES